MKTVSKVQIYGLPESVQASSYPMDPDIMPGRKVHKLEKWEKILNRAGKLACTDTGTGHDNFLSGIVVQADLALPVKVWTEIQRYHFIDIVSSQSTMHRIDQMNFSECFSEYVDSTILAILYDLRDWWRQTGDIKDFYRLIYSCPVGLILTARISTNYRQLKTIYQQRKDHKLPEWREICAWIETLPRADWITGKEPEVCNFAEKA